MRASAHPWLMYFHAFGVPRELQTRLQERLIPFPQPIWAEFGSESLQHGSGLIRTLDAITEKAICKLNVVGRRSQFADTDQLSAGPGSQDHDGLAASHGFE